MAYSHNAPFHADVVGSYLRPSELKVARMDFAAGTISAAELKAVEDKLITELVAKQKAAGLHVITDGEFRRGWWHFDFMWGFNGVDHAAAAHRVAFHDEVTPADTATVTGKITGENHPFVEHFKFVKQFEWPVRPCPPPRRPVSCSPATPLPIRTTSSTGTMTN